MKYKEKVETVIIQARIPKVLETELNHYCTKFDLKKNDFIKNAIKFYIKFAKQL